MSSHIVAQVPRDARRVVVRGTSGSGKSTLARRIAASIGAPYVELDAIFHQPGWRPLDDETFQARVGEFMDEPEWVVDGNYSQVAALLLARADTLVVFDLPKRTVMTRVVRRSVRRVSRREALWNGNRERLRNLVSRDPETSIIAWTWTTHALRHVHLSELVANPPSDAIRVVPMTSARTERLVYAGLVQPVHT